MSQPTAKIEARELSKSFDGKAAVADVSFSAPAGQITGLLGENGAGKTTTLRLLAGLLRPDAGTVSVGGLDLGHQRLVAQGQLGVLSDNAGLYPRLTPREHLRYAGRLHGLSGARLEAAVEGQITALGLAPLADRPTRGFSLGERRKVALARTLVHRPRFLLLDEPTNGLDVSSARAVRAVVRALAAAGCGVLLSSHQMREVAELCDTIHVLARGRLVASGSPAELLARTGSQDLEEAFVALVGKEEP